MIRLLASALFLLLTGCGPQVVSRDPLFVAGVHPLKPGLWALLEDGCAIPADRQIFDWPECATPIQVSETRLALLMPGPVRGEFLLSDGTPAIIQVRATEARIASKDRIEDEYPFAYYAFEPQSAPPYTAGRVLALRCPGAERKIVGITMKTSDDHDECIADRADAVRAVAGLIDATASWQRAAWIAPASG